nr:immunoglobulin light chain junction region [Macaca mulatta]MOY05794.1 immunoglobulin light chain junction region [Macaca mulatta]MOY06010.1 immunoglobulin light chain junction region [Macaca mulatta]MOY06232.1 immunoglobulin light chain junction region [Macaca mulatta]MOY06956.1 immunoglobulin light chain junction region [Macaca mulatta]
SYYCLAWNYGLSAWVF